MTAPPFCSAKSPSAKILCSISPSSGRSIPGKRTRGAPVQPVGLLARRVDADAVAHPVELRLGLRAVAAPLLHPGERPAGVDLQEGQRVGGLEQVGDAVAGLVV